MKRVIFVLAVILLIPSAVTADSGYTRQTLGAVILVEDRFEATDGIEA